ncbi:MAG: type II secretion system GspH family protein [Syntrophales bacterium LBB04]|nr:type II secretion system GspH family protein [Syntrophales bacterium LBB04]
MKKRIHDANAGFSLIEVIITIVVLAFVASVMVSYFGTAMSNSGAPIFRLNNAAGLNRIIENITAQSRQIFHWQPSTAYAVNDIVVPTTPNLNGFQYICTASGTSGSQEPLWNIAGGVSVPDGTAQWQQNGNAPTLAGLQTAIGSEGQDQTNGFGQYRVIQNRFIKFDGSNTEVNIDGTPADQQYGRFLKIVIGFSSTATGRTSETRMALFVLR